jgi:curved DNA-binding protein CbpA
MATPERLPDLYGALGIAPGIDPDGVAAAYRSVARRAHPDAGGSHEQFLVVDLAWRLLRDADTRRRFDALWNLQVAVESNESTAVTAANRLMVDADAAVAGWRQPIELRSGVGALLERSHLWARRLAEEASRQGSTDDSPRSRRTTANEERVRREAEDMVRDSTERYVAYLRDAVLRDMEQWPQVLVRIRAAGTLTARRAALWDGYRTYSDLRALQDQLDDRGRQALTADQARLFFHVSDAVRDVSATLLAAQAPLGKSYSYKSEEWLVDRQRRAKRVLDDQKLEVGEPPWPPTRQAPTSAHTNGDQSSSEARPDRTQRSSRASQSAPQDRGEPPPPPSRPSPRASSPSGSPSTAPHAESSAHLTAAMRLAGAGVAVATLAVLAWFARAHLVDALTVALGVAALVGLAWVLIVNEEARRGLGLLLLGIAKLTWLVLRGFGNLALGLISLIGKRR